MQSHYPHDSETIDPNFKGQLRINLNTT
jgi:hypothetical protein